MRCCRARGGENAVNSAGVMAQYAYLAWLLALSCWVLLSQRRLRGGVAAQGDDDASEDYPDCERDTSVLGDAICDFVLNTADCGFDGGDCCKCTCVDTDESVCGENGAGFFCVDPNASENCGPTPSPTEAEYPVCAGYLPHVGDGYCDEDNNNAGCGYDGGDCCSCTCIDGPINECGTYGRGFDCRDPGVPPNCDVTPSPAAGLGHPDCKENLYFFQNGYCNGELNNAECGWDGGDCCRCTCRQYGAYGWYGSYRSYSLVDNCGIYGYDCLDPNAPTECDTDSPTPSPAASSDYPDCIGTIMYISDGWCDYGNNNADCGWDGGDCCPCTCEDGVYTCGSSGYSCEDPDADCVTTTSGLLDDDFGDDYGGGSPTSSGFCLGGTNVGDGVCDEEDNNAVCEYDGGDCCPCTCTAVSCGSAGYSCIDPGASCYLSPSVLTPSPTLAAGQRGDATLASAEDSSTSMSSSQIIGIFFGAVVGYCCVGATFAAALAVVRRKCQPKDESHNDQKAGNSPALPLPPPATASLAPSNAQLPPAEDAGSNKYVETDDGETKGAELDGADQGEV